MIEDLTRKYEELRAAILARSGSAMANEDDLLLELFRQLLWWAEEQQEIAYTLRTQIHRINRQYPDHEKV